MAGTITEVAPGRRRHSSVGLILGTDHHHHHHHQGSTTTTTRMSGTRSPEIRIQSSLFAGITHNTNTTTINSNSSDSRGRGLAEGGGGGGGRRGDRSSSNNNGGKMTRSVSDPKSRNGPDSKIMVLGMAAVGKSALVVRFLTNRFIWEYDPTLESTYRHVTTIDEEPAVMEILDTAGQGDVLQREGSVRWADGYVLVYAINDRASFDSVAALKHTLDDVTKTNVQCVLLANKADLLHERRVQFHEGEALAQEMSCAFYETSASDGGNDITEAFYELHREIKRRKMIESKGRRRSSAQQVRNVFNRVLNKIGSAS